MLFLLWTKSEIPCSLLAFFHCRTSSWNYSFSKLALERFQYQKSGWYEVGAPQLIEWWAKFFLKAMSPLPPRDGGCLAISWFWLYSCFYLFSDMIIEWFSSRSIIVKEWSYLMLMFYEIVYVQEEKIQDSAVKTRPTGSNTKAWMIISGQLLDISCCFSLS